MKQRRMTSIEKRQIMEARFAELTCLEATSRDTTSNTFFSTHTPFIAICVVWLLGTIGFITIALTTGDLESIALILIGLTLSLPCLYVIIRKMISRKDTEYGSSAPKG